MENKPLIVIHDRPICIGCAACVSAAPNHWEMNTDGRSDLKNCTNKGELQVKDLSEKDFVENMDAAELCPVNCIHIERDGKRLI